MDRMIKCARFLPVRITYFGEDYAKVFIEVIVRLHGVSVSIILD